MRKFGKGNGILVTKKDERSIDFEEGTIELIPAWKFLLKK
jgi:predicted AAA+ superfamily ATPase